MDIISIDFETHSAVDLLKHGAYRYAQDPSTDVYCLAWAVNDDEPQIWTAGEVPPPVLVAHIENGGEFRAWNAQFERLIWKHVLAPKHGFPEPKLEQYKCTAARARAHGLPGALGECARCMGLPQQKQAEGTRLIKTYSVNNVPWERVPEVDKALWIEYCLSDVVVERGIGFCLRELSDYEWHEYWVNERICDRGVPVDLALAAAALEYAEDVRADVGKKLARVTEGAVQNANQRTARDAWLLPQLTESQIELLTVYKNGVKKLSFDKGHREALAAHPDITPPVREWLECIEEAGGATISKYRAMLDREVNGRIQGTLLFNGAGQTGRAASRGFQAHNLRRDSFDDPEPIIKDLIEGYELNNVTETLARLVRSSVCLAQGLTWCDWSAIEGRVAPWLANSDAGERKLDLFRAGEDVYKHTAAATFGVPLDEVDKEQRQVGKVQELALQFMGGRGALQTMARNYGMVIPDARADTLRDRWRQANPWAQTFAAALDRATFLAMYKPGTWHEAGRVAYAYDGGEWLWCKLPSGRLLAYFKPQIEQVETPWGDVRDAITFVWGAGKAPAGEEWPRRSMHGGSWLQNVTQAAAADILRDAVVACEDAGLSVVLHVHDEIVVEGSNLPLLKNIMLQSPEWATGLPLAAEGGEGARYGK